MGKPRPRRPIDPARPETWGRCFDSDGKPRRCERCGNQFVPLVDGQDLCNDCALGKGRMMELGILFKSQPLWQDWRGDWPEWPKIKHHACTLFNHPKFTEATWDRLQVWLEAEHCQSIWEVLMMKPAEVAVLLRAAVSPPTNDAGRRESGGALAAGQPIDDFLTVEQLAKLSRVSVNRFHGALSEARKPASKTRPPEPIKRKRHYYSYGAIRPWLLSTWPSCPTFFPALFVEVENFLKRDAPAA